MSADSYGPLTGQDLRAFDKRATELVLEMVDHGWVGRISSKGHAIMRAPDGETTASISRDSLRGRSGRNSRAEFERWKRAQTPSDLAEVSAGQPETSPGSPDTSEQDLTPESGAEYIEKETTVTETANEALADMGLQCHICGEWLNGPRQRGPHMKKHRKAEACPQCGRQVKYLGTHLRSVHGMTLNGEALPAQPEVDEDRLGHAVEYLQSLLAETERLRRENEELRRTNEELRTRWDLVREAAGL